MNRVVYSKVRILLERRGKVIAAIVPVEDLEALEDRLDNEAADAALEEAAEKGTISWEKIKADRGL